MEKKVLTKQGLKKLKDELEYLQYEKRREVSDRIKQAKEFGDLSENAEYQEAKDEQAFVEGRILELEHLVKTADVVEENSTPDGVVGIGCKVSVDKGGEITDFTIVGSTEADPINRKISLESPIGAALMDKKIGEEVEIDLPSGKARYKILDIS